MAETPREPDRYEAKARELRLRCGHQQRALCLPCLVAALASEYAEAMGLAAQIAHRSQDDCFCKERPDDVPCAACMEAARIEGAIRGTADRLKPDPAAALRAVEAEALERAAKDYDQEAERLEADARRYDADGEGMAAAAHFHCARVAEANAQRLRALKPDPAAAPAAETGKEVMVMCSTDTDEHHGAHRLRIPTRSETSWCLDPIPVTAPAAETGKARAPFRDCTCYVANGKITPESRARCPRHPPVPGADEAEYLAVLRDMGETRKEDAQAQGAEALGVGYDADNDRFVRETVYLNAQKRIVELERALELAYPYVAEGDEGTEVDGLMHDQIVARINKVMRARATLP